MLACGVPGCREPWEYQLIREDGFGLFTCSAHRESAAECMCPDCSAHGRTVKVVGQWDMPENAASLARIPPGERKAFKAAAMADLRRRIG